MIFARRLRILLAQILVVITMLANVHLVKNSVDARRSSAQSKEFCTEIFVFMHECRMVVGGAPSESKRSVDRDFEVYQAVEQRPYNWTIQQRHFSTFTPILDLPHAIEHVYEVAHALHGKGDRGWEFYVRWITLIWQSQTAEVLQEMQREQSQRGETPKDCEEKDPRKVLAETITYLRNNRSRMDYPRYRREGLPLTSVHMESLVKEIGYRVKGSEKFWNDGRSAESILQIRAAALGDDERLELHLRNRPGNPFHPNVKKR